MSETIIDLTLDGLSDQAIPDARADQRSPAASLN
jgi:hypothetical protein